MAAGSALVLAAGALAGGYKDGTYTAGNTSRGAGVQIKVKHGSFSVQVIQYRETCTYGARTIHDYFTFLAGRVAKLRGSVKPDGHFSGRYASSAGTVTVSGQLQGSTATVKGTEHTLYNPGSTVHPNSCHGSQTFAARLK